MVAFSIVIISTNNHYHEKDCVLIDNASAAASTA